MEATKLLLSTAALVFIFFAGYAQCPPPSSVSATAASVSGKATWMPATGVSFYEYHASLLQEPNPSIMIGSGTEALLPALLPDTVYQVCVRSFCGTFRSGWVCDTVHTKPSTACNEPAVIASGINSQKGIVSWTPVTGAIAYEYELALTQPQGSGATTTTTQLSLASLASGSNYTFCVRSQCAASLYSPWVCDTFATDGAMHIGTTKQGALWLYPNPVTNLLSVKATTQAANSELTLTDVFGRTLYHSAMEKNEFMIDMSHLATGIYILRFYQGESSTSHKIQKL